MGMVRVYWGMGVFGGQELARKRQFGMAINSVPEIQLQLA